jgi:hypothetical protein
MPEHVHLLISEPDCGTMAIALQAVKQSVARSLILRLATCPELPSRRFVTKVQLPNLYLCNLRRERPRLILRKQQQSSVSNKEDFDATRRNHHWE